MKFVAFQSLVVSLFVGGAALKADPISISNFSFEDPALANPGDYSNYGATNTITGWQNGSFSGVQYYTTAANSPGSYQYASVPDGKQGAFSDQSAVIQQTLTTTLNTGSYTLSIDDGWRNGFAFASGSFGLYTTDGTMLGSAAFTQPTTQGTWIDNSITIDVLPGNAALGQDLVIEMLGTGGNGATIDFDDVRLDFEPAAVPEPSTWAMFGVGAFVMGLAVRRRAIA